MTMSGWYVMTPRVAAVVRRREQDLVALGELPVPGRALGERTLRVLRAEAVHLDAVVERAVLRELEVGVRVAVVAVGGVAELAIRVLAADHDVLPRLAAIMRDEHAVPHAPVRRRGVEVLRADDDVVHVGRIDGDPRLFLGARVVARAPLARLRPARVARGLERAEPAIERPGARGRAGPGRCSGRRGHAAGEHGDRQSEDRDAHDIIPPCARARRRSRSCCRCSRPGSRPSSRSRRTRRPGNRR
jgi:hypothetical protein